MRDRTTLKLRGAVVMVVVVLANKGSAEEATAGFLWPGSAADCAVRGAPAAGRAPPTWSLSESEPAHRASARTKARPPWRPRAMAALKGLALWRIGARDPAPEPRVPGTRDAPVRLRSAKGWRPAPSSWPWCLELGVMDTP